MARPRSDTATLIREGHSISLKVLRLSRPSLSLQHPLPRNNTAKIAHSASLAFPSPDVDQDFILSTNLALPPAFGSAYVGETFACSLCANNELPVRPPEAPNTPSPTSFKSVSSIRITAEMQTPSQTIPLQLSAPASDPSSTNAPQGSSFDHSPSSPGTSLQRILRFDLKEEGNHVLAVNVSYTETTTTPSPPSKPPSNSSRIRTFRKLYQFLASPCLNVRTKATELAPVEAPDKSLGPYGRVTLLRFVLEAQLENVSEERVVLERAALKPVPPFRSRSLNWDMHDPDQDPSASPTGSTDGDDSNAAEGGDGTEETALSPRDVMQVAFLVEQEQGVSEGVEELKASLKRDGRTVMGQIGIQWRSAMGEKGSLSTGNLLTRKR